MAGNGRFDLASAIPGSSSARNHCKRGGYSAPNLDRCVSFREGSDGRILNSCKAVPRGSSVSAGDAPSLSKSINLEPIIMDRGNVRSVVLKSILGLSAAGSSSEENSAYLRSSPPVAAEELRRFRASVAETCVKARDRTTNLVEHLDQLNKYSEARSLQKQQQSDLLMNERTGGYNVKIGNQNFQTPLDPGVHKLEDRPKNVILNRRLRTSVAETRAEARNCGSVKDPLVIPKDRDINSADSDVAVDKNPSLPVEGEIWDKKMKRKRSVGPICQRPEGEAEAKRVIHFKVSSESIMQSSDSKRPGGNDLCVRASKMDGTVSLGNSGPRATPKIEQEKALLSAEKARRFPKGNIKLNNPEENDVPCPSHVTTKGKVSRASRSSTAAMNTVANALCVSGTLEGWELPQTMNKNVSASGADTRKPATTLSPCSSSPITHWGSQRPPKNSRTRRAKIASPVSNHDEAHTPTEGFSPSDSSTRSQSSGGNNSLFKLKGMSNGLQNRKANPKIAVSPARLSDCEESGPGENRLQGKIVWNGLGENPVNAIQSVGSPATLMKKRKLLVKEESSDGLQRQGRSDSNSVSRDRIALAGNKSDDAALTKPVQSVTEGSERNGSKSGRPLKKLSDRKDVARMGNSSGGSLDFTGEQDDDREDIIAAANLAQSHRALASKHGIWRPAEPLFASISTEKKSYLLQERKKAEAVLQSLSQMPGCCTNKNAQSKTKPKDITSSAEPFDKGKSSSSSGGRKVKSLYQRVLTALIMEDDIKDYNQNGRNGFLLPHDADLDLCDYTRLLVNGDGSTVHGMELDYKSVFGRQTLSNGFVVDGLCHGNSSFDGPYDQLSIEAKLLLELHSIGLYPEMVPDLHDQDDDLNEESIRLKSGLLQQAGKKKEHLDAILDALEKGKDVEGQDMEQVAMDNLVEIANKKLSSTRNHPSKYGTAKLSKQVAVGFAKRTVGRCKKFEETGVSCFSEPPVRDIIHAPPAPCVDEVNPLIGSTGLGIFINSSSPDNNTAKANGSEMPRQAFGKSGLILNRGKKKEVLHDGVGSDALSRTPPLDTSVKWKTSGRDNGKHNTSSGGRGSLGNNNSRGERKLKSKPKQEGASNVKFFFSGGGGSSSELSGGGSIVPLESSKVVKESGHVPNAPTNVIESIDGLDEEVADIGEGQDLSSWFSEVDALQDLEPTEGLSIPMDDISQLFS